MPFDSHAASPKPATSFSHRVRWPAQCLYESQSKRELGDQADDRTEGEYLAIHDPVYTPLKGLEC